MKKTLKIALATGSIAIGIFAVSLPNIHAETAPTVTYVTTQSGQQESLAQVSIELGNLAQQIREIPTLPMNTTNEQEAVAAQVAAIGQRLGELAAIVANTP